MRDAGELTRTKRDSRYWVSLKRAAFKLSSATYESLGWLFDDTAFRLSAISRQAESGITFAQGDMKMRFSAGQAYEGIERGQIRQAIVLHTQSDGREGLLR